MAGNRLGGEWGAGAAATPAFYGWNENYDEGTTGDLFVDGGISSSGNGLTLATAKKTIAEAIAIATGGDTILIKDHGSPYREQFTTTALGGPSSANKTTFKGYGTDKPTISGAEILTGLVPCVSGDQAVVGPNWASMYKIENFDSLSIAGDTPLALNLHEDGEALNLAISRADNSEPFWTSKVTSWWVADEVYTTADAPANVGDVITGVKDTSVTDLYTQVQIENAQILLHVDPNVNIRVAIDSFDPSDDIIRVTTSGEYENVHGDSYALINLIPAMAVGGYGFVDNGDNTCNIYVWPTNPANITAGIEYTARLFGINLATVNNIEIASLRIVQNAVTGAVTHGVGIRCVASTKKSNYTIRNCYIAKHLSTSTSYGAVSLRNIDNCIFWNNTIRDIRGTYGVFAYGGSQTGTPPTITAADFMEDCDVRYNDIQRTEQSPYRFYTQRGTIFAFNKGVECGLGAHANKANFYEQNWNILVWGNDFTGSDGYFTWQETSNIFVAFNYIPTQQMATAEVGSGRAIDGQNNATNTPADYLTGDTTNLFFNNHCPPYAEATDRDNAFSVGDALTPSAMYSYWNNVFHGDVSVATYVVDADYNITTIDTTPGANSDVETLADMYTDAAGGDLSVKVTAPVRTKVGRDMRGEIASVLIPIFGDRFTDWYRDMNYELVAWDDAPVGETNYRAAAADATAPTIVTLSPADGLTTAAIDANLVITFSEPVIAGTGNISLYDASDDSLVEAFDVTTDAVFAGTTVTLNPASDLDGSTSYYVQIDATAIDDTAGNSFAGIADETTWNFTTASGLSAFSLDWVAQQSNLVDGASFTFTNVDFGDAPTGSDVRYGVIAIQGSRTIATTFSAVTVNGNAASVVAAADNAIAHTAIYLIALPTGSGASHTVAITCNFSNDGMAIDTFRMINPGSSTATDTASATGTTANDIDLSLDIPTGGKAIAVQGCNDNSVSTLTFTGVTATGAQIDLNGNDNFLVGLGGSAGTPHTVTASASGTPLNRSGCAASWGP